MAGILQRNHLFLKQSTFFPNGCCSTVKSFPQRTQLKLDHHILNQRNIHIHKVTAINLNTHTQYTLNPLTYKGDEHKRLGQKLTFQQSVINSRTILSTTSSALCKPTKDQISGWRLSSERNVSLSPRDIVDASPSNWKPYLKLIRFDKPAGTWLLLWPCTWSIGLATQAGHFPDPKTLLLFGAGSLVMRGAGCIVNDMWDSEFDKKVTRTKDRPLASGDLSHTQAFWFLGSQLSIALAILLQFNWYSVILGASSLGLVVIYPLMKRYTYWPQVILGMTFNWGTLLGYSAVAGGCNLGVVLPLYIAGISWTMIYDTIYAHQDKVDDIMIGVKSTALKFGDNTRYWLTGFGSTMIGGLALSGFMCDQTWPYYLGLSGVAAHIMWQVLTVDINSSPDCWKKFCSNINLGALLFIGIVAGTLYKQTPDDKQQTNDTDELEKMRTEQ
ncbi:unnamed protein product [Owenia fusiformis]|uniref:4-hydroxybenzoate polyprenyltransferase, mitochondrial n=1 Tax=Owenia fusiformis TaxID=6347 RepID=A0A8J1TGU1_OWEFU|nr:unnamed protein product [Owenia fusiformis]